MPRGCGQNLAYPGVGSAAAPRGARSPEPRSPGLPAGCGARSAGCRGLRGLPERGGFHRAQLAKLSLRPGSGGYARDRGERRGAGGL